MGRTFLIRALPASRLPQAYPLIRAIVPELTLDGWIRHALALNEGSRCKGGVVSAQGEDGYIYGLFCYTVQPDLRYGRTLLVDAFVALDLVDRLGAIATLTNGIDELARREGCAAVQIALPGPARAGLAIDDGACRLFCAAGYELEGARLCKRVKPGNTMIK